MFIRWIRARERGVRVVENLSNLHPQIYKPIHHVNYAISKQMSW